MLRRNALDKREKWLKKAEKKRRVIESAQSVIDSCVMTPEEAKEKYGKKTKIGAAVSAFLGTVSMTQAAFASGGAGGGGTGGGDEFEIVDEAIDFLLNLLMGVGVCFIAFGVISLAISFQSHDDSQKSKAVMAIVGGAIAVSVRAVLSALGVTEHLG